MSMTMTMCRSRSGRQVRSIVVPARAVARQSIERTSSPRTYSRRLSNSVPCPRTCTLVLPSSSRRRARREGRCRRAWKGGSTRMTPRASRRRWRPAIRSGPSARTTTKREVSSPRRRGSSGMPRVLASPAGMSMRGRSAGAPAVGCQASRTRPRMRRDPVLRRVRSVATGVPRRALLGRERSTRRSPGSGAAKASTRVTATHRSSHAPAAIQASMPASDSSTTGTAPAATSRGRRAVTNTADQTGTRVCCSTDVRTASTETPSSSASARRRMRWRHVGTSMVCTWSGVIAG